MTSLKSLFPSLPSGRNMHSSVCGLYVPLSFRSELGSPSCIWSSIGEKHFSFITNTTLIPKKYGSLVITNTTLIPQKYSLPTHQQVTLNHNSTKSRSMQLLDSYYPLKYFFETLLNTPLSFFFGMNRFDSM